MGECLFCKIGRKEIPAKLTLEDSEMFAFHDSNPQAPTHILICPRKHIAALAEAEAGEAALLGRMQLAAADLARQAELTSYRTVFNNGAGAGQSVFHLHLHLLGGRDFRWPPG